MPASKKPGAFTYVKDAANNESVGSAGGAVVKTADFDTIGYSLGNAEFFGILVIWDTYSGTSPLLDVTVEFSFDGGTTWLTSYPSSEKIGASDIVQAHIDQIDLDAADGDAMQYWRNVVPLAPSDGLNPQVRFKFNFGGTVSAGNLQAMLFYVD